MVCKSVLLQMVIFVGIGAGIGFAHSRIAPVKLERDKMAGSIDKVLEERGGKGGTKGGTDAEKPGGVVTPPVKPTEPVTSPTVPAVPAPGGEQPKAPAVEPKPAEAPKGAAEETLTQAQIDKGHITIKQAHALYTANPPAYFVDTRRKEEYEAGHVKDAWGIPLAAFHGKTPSLVKDIDRSEIFVVYCIGGDCDESEQVAKQLDQMGYKHVFVMHAGFPGWEKAGLPIDKGPGIQEAE